MIYIPTTKTDPEGKPPPKGEFQTYLIIQTHLICLTGYDSDLFTNNMIQ